MMIVDVHVCMYEKTGVLGCRLRPLFLLKLLKNLVEGSGVEVVVEPSNRPGSGGKEGRKETTVLGQEKAPAQRV